MGQVRVGLEEFGNFQGGFPEVSGGEWCGNGRANEDVVGSLWFLVAVGADWGGGLVNSILVGLEFGAVGGSKLSKNGSVWAGKKGFRCVDWGSRGI